MFEAWFSVVLAVAGGVLIAEAIVWFACWLARRVDRHER